MTADEIEQVWKAEIARLKGVHRQALAERDAEINQRVEEIAALEADLAAARERETRLREALGAIAATPRTHWVDGAVVDIARAALAREDGGQYPDNQNAIDHANESRRSLLTGEPNG